MLHASNQLCHREASNEGLAQVVQLLKIGPDAMIAQTRA
jgi:hypothetical protein